MVIWCVDGFFLLRDEREMFWGRGCFCEMCWFGFSLGMFYCIIRNFEGFIGI